MSGSTIGQDKQGWSGQFYLLCLSSFLFFCSFNLVIAELPSWLDALGGSAHLGLVIPLFTLTALIARPISGHLADTIGRVPVVYFGVLVSALCAVAYPFMLTMTAFFLLRSVHGLSTGFAPTGMTALLADVLPVGKRGEGLGILGMSGSLGMAVGPWLGSTVAGAWGTTPMFLTSAACAVASMLVLLGMRETLPRPRPFHFRMLLVPRDGLIEPRVFAPAFATLLCLFPFGVVVTLAPDMSIHNGLANKGTFFLYYVLTSVLVRFPAGRISDRIGRATMMLLGSVLLAVAMAVIAMARTSEHVLIGAVITGLASGINSPVIFAWTVDLAHPKHRARAMATTFIALELGIGLGGLTGGYLFAQVTERLPLAFWVASVVSLLSVLYLSVLLLRKRSLRRRSIDRL